MAQFAIDVDPDAVTIWCYCCETFTPHTEYPDEEGPTYYECNRCGCVIDDEVDEVIYPEN